MLSDIEIAQKAKIQQISQIAKKAGIKLSELEFHGPYKAKVSLNALKRLKNKKPGKLILVTTMSPTPQGEGKTTTTIGLAEALLKLGKKAFVCIREPSLGPVMGMKGGAAGGGYSQVIPMDDINLHLTGDMHMITSAHNLLTAMLHNHIYQGNELNIDENRIVWKRVMDMNDRSLRGRFDITASSEVMAILCLSKNVEDMKKRLGEIIIAYDKTGKPIHASDIAAQGAMALLLWHALKPNLVQTLEGGPAFIHGGPFANIAHGCNSLVATELALKLSSYVVTEAGFGTDLGAEKFFDIKCRAGKLKPAAAILVVTKQAIERHGYENAKKHLENLKSFGIPVVIAINKKADDSKQELEAIKAHCSKFGVGCVISNVWEKGGRGGIALAKAVINLCKQKSDFHFLYDAASPIKNKLEAIATKIYGADGVDFSDEAEKDIELLEKIGMSNLPVCVAKTQYSLSDDKKLYGCPKGVRIKIRELKPSAGAGFVVAYAGAVMTMPGLPKHPAAENMDVSEDGKIKGLF
ncbi:MAG: formate--tetrahydrofolate ligase [Candidatus Saganbacteria bacterium]|nr:formate--tetrahydrofolate ligase [Candidatus Saganbacteria bacterium]